MEKNKEPSILITFREKNDHSFLDLNVNTTPQHVEDALLSLAAFLGGAVIEEQREKLAEILSEQVKEVILNQKKQIVYNQKESQESRNLN